MNNQIKSGYGQLIEPASIQIQRLLPGPIERIWTYLTESDKRRKWLAAGEMEMKAGSSFTLTWRNDELTSPAGERPETMSAEHSMQSQITELEPPKKISFTWGTTGGVTFELEPRGDKVLLTVTHYRAPDHSILLGFSTGWHAHLDVLVAVVNGEEPEPFWDHFKALRKEYERRLRT
ncbi:MAG: SRPBCC family protein [Alphaproteobacteria bacterium]|nr:MAG: SRPBCC family protein [Alphaproteobacteria bacterium]